VKTYFKIRVIEYLFIKCVQWASARLGVFYIFNNFSKNFLPDPNIRLFLFGLLNERGNNNSARFRQNGKEVNSNEEIFFSG